jgi:hypothetical protein
MQQLMQRLMTQRSRTWLLVILFAFAVVGVLFLWWLLDLRWRPHQVVRNQAEIGHILQGSGWVAPGLSGPKLYVVAYRDCASCNQFAGAELPALQKAGVDTRVVMFARRDVNGQAKSTPVERATVAELWVNRSWPLYQRWRQAAGVTWAAPGLSPADGDVARSAVIEAGRSLVDQLTPLMRANGVRMDYPLLVWWTPNGAMQACGCAAAESWNAVRRDLGMR